MTNIRLSVAYDGTGYYGWQKTAAGPSIEGELQKALQTILQYPVLLQSASRTDRGVHAKDQVVNFFLSSLISNFEKFQFQLNCILPKDIRILGVKDMPKHFHPTLDVVEKTYSYDITTSPLQLPHKRHYSWHIHCSLDIALMKEAASKLIGTHDFRGFTNKKCSESYTDYMRTINDIKIVQNEDLVQITIAGTHFLYKMVRNIVGTIVFIGCKKLTIHVINELLTFKNRTLAGITSPAHGLTLINIKYKE